MRLILILVVSGVLGVVVVLGAVSAVVVPSASAAASRSVAVAASARERYCGTIVDEGARVAVTVRRGRVACREARRVLRAYFRSKAPCSGSGCVRDHDGWTCITASWMAFPRLASCSRRQALVSAYSTAD